MSADVICDYCNQPARMVKGSFVYPRLEVTREYNFWYCDNGHEPAYVGTHRSNKKSNIAGTVPLGRLANYQLREAKKSAHAAFDPLWKQKTFSSRSDAYRWLSKKLGIPLNQTHIGMFTVEQCVETMRFCKEYSTNLNCALGGSDGYCR